MYAVNTTSTGTRIQRFSSLFNDLPSLFPSIKKMKNSNLRILTTKCKPFLYPAIITALHWWSAKSLSAISPQAMHKVIPPAGLDFWLFWLLSSFGDPKGRVLGYFNCISAISVIVDGTPLYSFSCFRGVYPKIVPCCSSYAWDKWIAGMHPLLPLWCHHCWYWACDCVAGHHHHSPS